MGRIKIAALASVTMVFATKPQAEAGAVSQPRCSSVTGRASSFMLGGENYTHADGLQGSGDPSHVECFRVKGQTDESGRIFCLPSWTLLASGKAGSSALWKFLCGDKETHSCRQKEMHYANWVEAGRAMGEVDAVLKYFPRDPGTSAGFVADVSQRDLAPRRLARTFLSPLVAAYKTTNYGARARRSSAGKCLHL